MADPRFTPQSLAFLRGLKRHNRRDWFLAHRDDYDRHVRAPMLAIVERLAADFRVFAPGTLADPKTSIYRIHRDVRFSADKAPYKTHVAAVFPARGLAKHEGAAFYFHVSPSEVWVGGGMYAPQTAHLLAVREHIVSHLDRLKGIVGTPAFRRTFGGLEGERLQRVPRGFPKESPAADYLKYRQFLAAREYPASHATGPTFYRTLVDDFRRISPLMAFLNEPLR